jgi:hypothetical protein
MTWLTLRQFRGQAIAAAAVLVAFAMLFAVTGPHLVNDFRSSGLSTCHLNCGAFASRFSNDLTNGGPAIYEFLFFAGIVALYLVPALIGIFWGAPLVARELETGTFRLGWNQSVTRTRWAVAKLAIVGLASMATAGLLSLMISWWAGPVDTALRDGGPNTHSGLTRIDPLVFGARGIAPIGYAAFAFALGVTAGLLLRRTLPAMALTLAVFLAVQLLVPTLVRPHLIPPEHTTSALAVSNVDLTIQNGGHMIVTGPGNQPGAWVISNQTITPSGQVFDGPATSACLGNSFRACESWLAGKRLRQAVTYQPASRFWPLQWIETGLYLVLSAGLGWLCVWQIRRRRA